MDLEGSRLGKYELHAEIGRGELGAVYRGYDPDVDRRVAVKVLAPHLGAEDGFTQRFLRTVQAAARLTHPHIVTIYDMGKSDNRYFYVMEYLEGQPLNELLRELGPLSTDKTLSLLRQMTAALDHAHAQGMVHGGVKPSNVMIVGQDRVKMTDFGFVRSVQQTGPPPAGMSIDSLRYVSPEQASGNSVGRASDLYSLAVVAYEMLTGAPPFDADSKSDLLYKQVHEPAPSILLERPDLSLAVDEVFDRALAKQPERRYWSGTTFVTSLAEAVGDQSSAVAIPATPTPSAGQARQEPSPPPAKRLAWGWLAGAALVLILLVVGALASSGVVSHPQPTPTFDIVALLTEVPNPVSTMTPTNSSAPAMATETPSPEPTVPTTPTDAAPPSDEPGSIVTVRVPVADVRSEPNQASERVTQVIMGEKVMIQQKQDGWYRVTAVDQPSPKDPQGYPGWLEAGAVSLEPYEPSQVAIVMVPSAPVRSIPTADGPVIREVSIDSRLAFQSANDAWVAVTLPDGDGGWIARDLVRLVCSGGECNGDVAAAPDDPLPAEQILDTAKQLMGTRYLWGGTSSTAFDCSGFIYRVFHANGITIPRDSLPMSQSGTWVEREELQPGDIIFTSQGGPLGRVSHCALYIGDGQIITTVGTDPVAIVPLDSERYRNEYWGARRYP